MSKTVTLRDTLTEEALYPITLPLNVVDANGNSINTILEDAMSVTDVPTLQSAPTNSTLTYIKDNQTINFKIGLLCRVEDLSLINGYSFYRLHNFITENNTTTAIWQLIGTSYSDIVYGINIVTSASNSISLDGTIPIHIISLSGNVSSVALTNNPATGHSCHVIFTATYSRTVQIGHDATNRVCPWAKDLSLDVPAGGYIEVDFLTANGKVYVRGV